MPMSRALVIAGAVFAATGLVADPTEVTWIAAEPVDPRPGDEVAVTLMHGGPFAGVEQDYHEDRGALFQHLWKNGRANLGVEGGSPAARIRPSEPGVHLLAYGSAAGGREHYAKALLVVAGAVAGGPLRWSELGQRLEVVPQTDPVDLLRRGGRLEIQVLWEREPLAGATVLAVPRSAPRTAPQQSVTDEIGVATFDLDREDLWMIGVAHSAPTEDRRSARVDSTATLVLAAGPQR
jgi:hypothetical protein